MLNDQCIAIGWAGYDAKVSWLPPEHYLAHSIGRALARSCQDGRLKGHGPDGKLLVRVRESTEDWSIEQVLVTLQQLPHISLLELTAHILQLAAGRLHFALDLGAHRVELALELRAGALALLFAFLLQPLPLGGDRPVGALVR